MWYLDNLKKIQFVHVTASKQKYPLQEQPNKNTKYVLAI